MVRWDQTPITSVQLDGDPWKTRWTAMQPGDRPTLADWMIDAPTDDDEHVEAKSQAEMETEHNADEEEESDEPVHQDRKVSKDRSIAQDAGKCMECQLPAMPRRGYATFQGEIV
jgi:hypothetical protein